jgi:hypothetical protein
MKEGYLQTKISELNDKCKLIDQMISIEESKIRRLRQKVGNYKDLLKKLDDIQEIKKQIVRCTIEKNEKNIKDQIKYLSDKAEEIINRSINNKLKKINDILNILNKTENDKKDIFETISYHTNEIRFLIGFNDLLMMKLVNKGVISDRDVNEMQLRATKKAKEGINKEK